MVPLMSTQLNALVAASNVPTQSAWYGTNTTKPFGASAAPANFQSVPIVALMSTQLNVLVAASNVPTQSALRGPNTTKPFGATAAPKNLLSMPMVALMLTQLNALVAASKYRRSRRCVSANTTRPFGATAAVLNLLSVLIILLMSMQLNALVVALKVPTQSACFGANTARPFAAIAAPLNLPLVTPMLMSTQVKACAKARENTGVNAVKAKAVVVKVAVRVAGVMVEVTAAEMVRQRRKCGVHYCEWLAQAVARVGIGSGGTAEAKGACAAAMEAPSSDGDRRAGATVVAAAITQRRPPLAAIFLQRWESGRAALNLLRNGVPWVS